eukprot:jgi/Tetstr1/466937/TSEL_011391.t1
MPAGSASRSEPLTIMRPGVCLSRLRVLDIAAGQHPIMAPLHDCAAALARGSPALMRHTEGSMESLCSVPGYC